MTRRRTVSLPRGLRAPRLVTLDQLAQLCHDAGGALRGQVRDSLQAIASLGGLAITLCGLPVKGRAVLELEHSAECGHLIWPHFGPLSS